MTVRNRAKHRPITTVGVRGSADAARAASAAHRLLNYDSIAQKFVSSRWSVMVNVIIRLHQKGARCLTRVVALMIAILRFVGQQRGGRLRITITAAARTAAE